MPTNLKSQFALSVCPAPILLDRGDDDETGHWITEDGTHIFINEAGTIEKGPANLVGKGIEHLPPRSRKVGKSEMKSHSGKGHETTGHGKSLAAGSQKNKDAAKSYFAKRKEDYAKHGDMMGGKSAPAKKPEASPAKAPAAAAKKPAPEMKSRAGNDVRKVWEETDRASKEKLAHEATSTTGKARPPHDVQVELRSSFGLGTLTLPTLGGKLPAELEEAYRRNADKMGLEIGEFKRSEVTGNVSAPVTRKGESAAASSTPPSKPAEKPAPAKATEAAKSPATAPAKPEAKPAESPKPALKSKAATEPAKSDKSSSDLRARRQARMSELRQQGKSTTEAAAQATRELGTDPNAKAPQARPAMHPEPSKPVASKPAEPQNKPAEKAPETPATDFHERVKQLKASGMSQERAVIKAKGEANERAVKGQAKPAEKPAIVPPTAEKHLEQAKAAHAAGDQEKFAEHAGKANLTKAEIQRQLVESYRKQGGGFTAHDDAELSQFHNPYTFKRDPKTGSYPGEVKDFLEGRAHLKKLFTLTDDSSKAGGEDAMGHLGSDRYFATVERAAQGETNAALEAARSSNDPGDRFLAAVHDTMPDSASSAKGQATKLRSRAANAASPEARKALEHKADLADKRAKDASDSAKPKEMVSPEKLEIDTAGTINGIPVHVTEDEDGTRILQDGGDLPETPVDALRGPVPFDKGSLHKQEPKAVANDFFVDVKDEPVEAKKSTTGIGAGNGHEIPLDDYRNGKRLSPEMYDGLKSSSGFTVHVKDHGDGTFTVTHEANGVHLPLATRADKDAAQNAAWRAAGSLHDSVQLVGQHRKVVENALAQGKNVPTNVLKDYPDIARKFGKSPASKPDWMADEPELKSNAGKEGAKPFRTSGQLDLQGNEVGALTGSQKGLFAPAHEPVKVEVPQAPRIGSANAADPKHTAEMFPEKPSLKSEAAKSTNAIGDRVKQIQKEARDNGGNVPFNKALAQAKSEAAATPPGTTDSLGGRMKKIFSEATGVITPKAASTDPLSPDFFDSVPTTGATAAESATISDKSDYTQSQIEHHQNAAKAADTAAAGMKSQAGKLANQRLAEAHRTVATTLKTTSIDKEAAAHFKSRAYANLETAKKGVKEAAKAESPAPSRPISPGSIVRPKGRPYATPYEVGKVGVGYTMRKGGASFGPSPDLLEHADTPIVRVPAAKMGDTELHHNIDDLRQKPSRTTAEESHYQEMQAESANRTKARDDEIIARTGGDQNKAAQDYVKFPQKQVPYSRQAHPRQKFLSRAARELVTL